ncbi:MAG: flagellar motor switch protein FliN [Myxococcales bacterium]|nr:flagellar motor switch protein FliN [Myxococcales bacterium]MCB9648660.1 flagellar motor switch protein FliN [Deltaproteobacteria bacterium]
MSEQNIGQDGEGNLGNLSAFADFIGDVPVKLTVELGRVTLSLREVMERLGPGSVIPLTKLTGEKLDVFINSRLVARGEAVAVGDRYGIRITEIVGQPQEGR